MVSIFTRKKPIVTKEILHKSNVILSLLLIVEGILIVSLSKSHTLPVTTNFLTPDPLQSQANGHTVFAVATKHLFDVSLAYIILIYFLILGIAHGVAAYYRINYEKQLNEGVNVFRWIAVGLSISLALIVIALLSGIYDISTLIAIFSFSMIMHLISLVMEQQFQLSQKFNWLSFLISVKAGAIAWLILLIYIFGARAFGDAHLPAFLYWIFVTSFILFAGLLANSYLRFKKIGQWSDYLFSEAVYSLLGFLLTSALAWQVFAGILHR